MLCGCYRIKTEEAKLHRKPLLFTFCRNLYKLPQCGKQVSIKNQVVKNEFKVSRRK